MEEKNFVEITNDMVENLITDIQAIVNRYANMYGAENAMHCFGSALAIAGGNMLSTTCFGLSDQSQRNPFINSFFKLLRESADSHRKRVIEKQH